MAPNTFAAAKGVVNFMLDNYDYQDACFLAERLHAEIKSEDSLKLLASCFYRSGDFYKSYYLLRSSDYYKDADLKFLLAQCCYQMKKYTEAESLLTCNSVFKKDGVCIDDIINEFGSSAAFALFLIGDINRISCRRDRAKEYYKKCLNLNPFMWSAYQNLCDIEDKTIDVDTLFTRPQNLDYCLDVSSLAPEYPKANPEMDPFIIPRDMSTPWLMNRSEIVTAKKVVPPSQVCPVVHNAPSKQANFTCSKPVLNPAPCSTNTMGCNNSSINTTNPATATESTQLSGFGTPLPLEPDEGLDMCGPHFSCLSVKEESTVDTGIASRSQTDDSSVGSSGNRRLTRRQTKLMAAQNTPEGMVPCFTETSPTGPAAFITPEGQNMADSFALRAPQRKGVVPVTGMLTKHNTNPVMLQTINSANANEADVVSPSLLTMPPASASVPLAPTNNNSSNQQRFNTSSLSLATSNVNHTNQNQLQSSSNQISGHLATSQQANSNMSPSLIMSNLSTTPLQQPSSNSAGGMGLRRSSRLYNGSNQLKENSKSLSKGSLARRQKQLERAPNKSNSITNVLNADEEKLVTVQSQLAPTKQKQAQPSNKDSVISLVSTMDRNTDASTQTFCLANEASRLPQSSDAANSRTNFTMQPTFSDLETFLQVFKILGKSYHLLCRFQCEQSISTLQSLPPEHFETGWVLECLGKAYFEKNDFHNAAKVFKHMWDVDNHRLSGLDLYSTVLWQLKLSEDLSYLAHQVTLITKKRPEVWCVVGNCFSLQKEHEGAIEFLSRAIQLDPNYVYAYTLLGFEYLEIEMTAKAENCFRNAIRINDRHYKAWFGLGTLFSHQEKYVDAEVHYSKALAIRRSPSLLCHLAVVLHKLGKSQQALDRLSEALVIDPKNALCKYNKAMILNSLNRSQEGLKILEELKLQIPNESLLYFSIGKVYKKLGEPHLEMMNVAWAMDLDPKGSSSLIKQAIERRFLPQDEDMRANVDRVLEDTYNENLSDTEIIDNTIEVDFLNYTP